MGMKKNDTTFGFLTRNMSESIDLCLILFAFLISKKNAFKNSDMALPLNKYKDFFKILYGLSLFEKTRFNKDAKYKDLITAVMNDEESESLKDESYFFSNLEEEVKIHNKDSKKQMRTLLLPLSCFILLFGLIYIFVIIKTWYLSKTISPLEIILEGIPAILILVLGIFLCSKCNLSLKVYSHKEKDPLLRSWYQDIDIDYCFKIMNSAMKRIYNEINESNAKTTALEEIVNTFNNINQKASSIEELSNNIELLINPTEDSKLIDDFISYGAPLKKTPKGVRCAGSTNSLVHWIVEGYYDDPGRVDWIVENVKDKNGKKLNRETLMEYFRDNRDKYKTNKNLKKIR